ncbi:hypothetical protein L7F22_020051 [Adiantum nelumboides]|nr:hypothetical protein [Adiantum nelumboides]
MADEPDQLHSTASLPSPSHDKMQLMNAHHLTPVWPQLPPAAASPLKRKAVEMQCDGVGAQHYTYLQEIAPPYNTSRLPFVAESKEKGQDQGKGNVIIDSNTLFEWGNRRMTRSVVEDFFRSERLRANDQNYLGDVVHGESSTAAPDNILPQMAYHATADHMQTTQAEDIFYYHHATAADMPIRSGAAENIDNSMYTSTYNVNASTQHDMHNTTAGADCFGNASSYVDSAANMQQIVAGEYCINNINFASNASLIADHIGSEPGVAIDAHIGHNVYNKTCTGAILHRFVEDIAQQPMNIVDNQATY